MVFASTSTSRGSGGPIGNLYEIYEKATIARSLALISTHHLINLRYKITMCHLLIYRTSPNLYSVAVRCCIIVDYLTYAKAIGLISSLMP